MPAIVALRAAAAGERAPVDPARVLAGSPVTAVANAYSDAGGRFHCGTWSSSPGRWRVHYEEHEFCHLLEGRVRLVDEHGTAVEFGPGDAFVVPAGFAGTWESLEPVRKHYVIYESASTG